MPCQIQCSSKIQPLSIHSSTLPFKPPQPAESTKLLKNLIYIVCICSNCTHKLVTIAFIIMLILEFSFNFSIGVNSSITVTYLKQSMTVYLQATPLVLQYLAMDPVQYAAYNWSIYTYRLTLAEAIVPFAAALPIIMFQLGMILAYGLRPDLGEEKMVVDQSLESEQEPKNQTPVPLQSAEIVI